MKFAGALHRSALPPAPLNRSPRDWATVGRSLAIPALLLLFSTGCVSAKYKLAPKSSALPPSLNLQATTPVAQATLQAVVVFHGPGSWKKNAYWDEYLVTVSNVSPHPLIVSSAVLTGLDGEPQVAGPLPWQVEKLSRERLKVAKHTGRNIALGAGATVAWVGSAALIASNLTIWGGVTNASAVAAGTAGLVGIPLVALGSGVRTLAARHAIAKEYQRRRLALPTSLPPGVTRSGSLFFPVTPGPRTLRLSCIGQDEVVHELVVDLAVLADLHLSPAQAQKPGDSPTTNPTTAP